MDVSTEMETLEDLVAVARERQGTAIDALDRTTPYSYREFATNIWKAGNLLGHYGARGGTVAVAVGPKASDEKRPGFVDCAEPLLAILGGTLLGVPVTVVDDAGPAASRTTDVETGVTEGSGATEISDATGSLDGTELPDDTRVLVLPWGWVEQYDPPPACSVVAYGGPPTDPSVAHFEANMWSETPVEPPERVEAADAALRLGGETYTHGALLAAAGAIVETLALDDSSAVGLAVPVTSPGGFVAGVLAPLSVGATIQLTTDRGPGRLLAAEKPAVVLTDGVREDGASENETREPERSEDGRCVPVSTMTGLVREVGKSED